MTPISPSTNSQQQEQKKTKKHGVTYQAGFGNSFESEAIAGALPRGRNNPRRVPFHLYTEQLSGTAFTSPRHVNRRTWLYRIQPSVVCLDDFEPVASSSSLLQESSYPKFFGGVDPNEFQLNPSPLRWGPMPEPTKPVNFVSGMVTMAMSGDVLTKDGLAISMYALNQNMDDVHLYNSDGDFLIVPQQGSLTIGTEMGILKVSPNEICVVPRGIVFQVNKTDDNQDNTPFARGYVLEVFKGHFQLPALGPIGSNGLANPRDFLYPQASFVDNKNDYHKPCTILNKYGGQLFARHASHSPYNVVAWHGNYLPFTYHLELFCAVNSVTYDHLDPSIYTVLTCVGNETGTALADFVIFPPRIMATDDNTFRPPWFHRNTMSEFMGLIDGSYDAKEGFVAGGASLHLAMTPHGPDSGTYEKAIAEDCSAPTKFEGGLAFMFETSHLLKLNPRVLDCDYRDVNYSSCWHDLKDNFPWEQQQHEEDGE